MPHTGIGIGHYEYLFYAYLISLRVFYSKTSHLKNNTQYLIPTIKNDTYLFKAWPLKSPNEYGKMQTYLSWPLKPQFSVVN